MREYVKTRAFLHDFGIYIYKVIYMYVKKWHIAGFIFILVFGVFLHFAYDLSGQSEIVGYFSAVNESIWEHLKLVFWPAFLFSFIEYFFYGKKEVDFFCVKMCAVFSSLLWIVVAFYTYSGVMGFNIFAVDIFIFISSVFICQYVSSKLLQKETFADASDNLRSFVVLLLFVLCFIIWTKNPPDLGIFWG